MSILDATTLAPLAKAQTADLGNGHFSSVAWSRDGATLVAGGAARAQFNGEWRHLRAQVRRIRAATGRGYRREHRDDLFADIQPCAEGFVFATAEPSFGLVSQQGVATVLQGPHTADMRNKLGEAFAVSPDIFSVRFGLGFGDGEAGRLRSCHRVPHVWLTFPSGFASAKVEMASQ